MILLIFFIFWANWANWATFKHTPLKCVRTNPDADSAPTWEVQPPVTRPAPAALRFQVHPLRPEGFAEVVPAGADAADAEIVRDLEGGRWVEIEALVVHPADGRTLG